MRGWTLLAALGLLALLLAPQAAPLEGEPPGATPLRFLPNVRVTDGSSPYAHQVEPSLAVDGQGRLFVGWKEASTPTGAGVRVGFARSLDGGLTWSPNVLMDRLADDRRQSDPWLAVDPRGRLYFARLDYSADFQGSGVVVSRSDDGGATWGPMVDVDDQPGDADKEALIADAEGNLYLAYDDVGGNGTSIRFTSSSDGGARWSPTVGVNDRAGGVLGPVLAAAGGTVLVAWWDARAGNIMVDASGDGGLTWGIDVRVNGVPGSARPDPLAPWGNALPSVASGPGGAFYVAWPDRGGGGPDIVVARSDDGGRTWSAPARVNDERRGERWMPALAVGSGGILHIAWMDARTGNLNVFYSRSTDGGATWATNVRVSTEETPARYVRPGDYLGLAVDGNGTAAVAWTDGRGPDLDIYMARGGGAVPGAPWAAFTLVPLVGNTTTEFVVNASGSWDAEDGPAALRVRWDWEGDGTWDTPWTAQRTATHRFPAPGSYPIHLEVEDSAGLRDETTQIARVVGGPPTARPSPLPLWAPAAALALTSATVLGVVAWAAHRRRPPGGP